MNEIEKKWEELEKSKNKPFYFDGLKTMSSKEFLELNSNDQPKINQIIEDLYKGCCYIVKNALSKEFINQLKISLTDLSNSNNSEFYKMLDGCPNYFREINEDLAKNYSVKAVRTSYYFFRWNKDNFKLYENFDPIWRKVKMIGGLNENAFENNVPSNGIVDRIQVVKYPPLTGYIEPHQHDTSTQKIIISIYMSKKGEDYKDGGTYFYKKGLDNDKEVEVESQIDIGDVGLFYGSLKHSVKSVSMHNNSKNDLTSGRWWCGLYSPETDYNNKRKTSRPSK